MKGTTYRSFLSELIKFRFSTYDFYPKIESDIATMIANIPENDSELHKKEIICDLKSIKLMIANEHQKEEDLLFLDEEIKKHERIHQVITFEEKEDSLSQEEIKRYMDCDNEGMLTLNEPYTNKQLHQISQAIFTEKKILVFLVSDELRVTGKLVAEIYEYPQKIPLISVIEPKRKEQKENVSEIKKEYLRFFGDKIIPSEEKVMRSMEFPFYIYRFISHANQEFMILSHKEIKLGEYTITGTIVEVDDLKMITDSARLPTKLPYVFIKSFENRIMSYPDKEALSRKLKELDVKKDDFLDNIFTIWYKKKNCNLIARHPRWFKWLIWAFMLHSKIGLENEYPMHLFMLGDPSGGKSTLLNRLRHRTGEVADVFSGSSSTLKSLVPSFKNNPAKYGYLAESNRFAFCDEFLRCVLRTRDSNHYDDKQDESLAIMNDLLEHQKRQVGSGVSTCKVNMTARVLAASNPVRGTHNVTELCMKFDKSWLSRLLVYHQTKEHMNMILKAKIEDLEKLEKEIDTNDIISFVDYLQSFESDYDEEKVYKIYEEPKGILNEDLMNHYLSRHRHHILCLMDGLVKSRCLFENDMSFKAVDRDYDKLRSVWFHIVNSWMEVDVKKLPVECRIDYLPETAQYIYSILNRMGSCDIPEFRERVTKRITDKEFKDNYILLMDNGLIWEDEPNGTDFVQNLKVHTYWCKKEEQK